MDALESVARALVPPGKGILAADESDPTIAKGFAAPGIENTGEPAMTAWKGQPTLVAAGQRALYHRARCNGAARDGRYTPGLERAIT